MKHYNFYSMSLVTMLLFSMNACDSKTNTKVQLIGEWSARWETNSNKNLGEIHNNNLFMDGIMKFMENGMVEISAYGYEGCIFSDDTIKNVLKWKMDDSVLKFIDSEAESGLSYDIKKFADSELQLTLLEDISLTLRRD